MTWRVVRASALIGAPWRNGRGTSYEIAGKMGEDVPSWQVSIAELERDGPFSFYPHCDRVFTPIAGAPPPELSFGGGPFEACPLLVPKPFPGDVRTESRVPAPGRAFNAIVDRRHHRVDVRVARDEEVSVPEGAVCGVVHCLAGRMEWDGGALEGGDSAVGAGDGRLTGVGLVVAIFPV